MKKYLLLSLFTMIFALGGAEKVELPLPEMVVRFFRGGAMVDDATVKSGKVAKVGRDWSIQLFTDTVKPGLLDRNMCYDIYAVCKGEFTLGIYSVKRSGYIAPNRKISTGDWQTIRVAREKFHEKDYFTTDGVGKPGFVGGVIFVPHPQSAEEAAVAQRDLPGFTLDLEEPGFIELSCFFAAPVKFFTGMGKNKLTPAPELQLTAIRRSGKTASLKIPAGIKEFAIDASADDPVVKVIFAKNAKGNRTVAGVGIVSGESECCRIYAWNINHANVNSFDRIVTNKKLADFRNLSNYHRQKSRILAKNEPFKVVVESTMHKVFEHEIPERWITAPRKEKLRIAMAGRELESCQLVIVPDNGLTGKISVKWIPDGKIPVQALWHEVTFVESARRAYPQLNEKTTSYPDPLVDVEDSAVVARGKNIPLWLTFENPAGSVAGKFSGKVEIASADRKFVRHIPVEITLYGFDLPERSAFRTCFFLNRIFMRNYFGISDFAGEKAMARKIIAICAKNRLTLMPMLEHVPQTLRPMWKATKDADGKYHFDFTEENEITRMILDEFHGTMYNVAPSPTWDRYFGYMWLTDPATGKDSRLPYNMRHPEFAKIYRDFLQAAWANAQKNNWEKYAVHYIWDEWRGDDWNRLHLLSKRYAPELKTLAVGYNRDFMPENVRNAVNIWVPLTSKFDKKFAAERVAKGDESWAYVCVSPKNRYNLFVDHEAFSHRALLWWCQQNEVTGLLYWGVCFWLRAVNDQKTGVQWPQSAWQANQYPDANGDGYLLYPDKEKGKIYSSIRLSVLRDGLEDMEYFIILREMKKSAAGQNTPESKAFLAELRKIEARIPGIIAAEKSGHVRTEFNGDQLESLRNDAGELISRYYQLFAPLK